MSITFKRGKRIVSYAEATTVSEVLEISKRKSRSFCREERDRWDWRGYNEYIVAVEGRLPYMGHTVNFKTEKTSFRDKRRHQTSKDSWVVFENTQEAIIDEETFQTAQKLRKTGRHRTSLGEANPLTGLLYCADCGAKLYNEHRINYKGNDQFEDNYVCSS